MSPQPEYVPLGRSDRVRTSERLPAPQRWMADRPADFSIPAPPAGDSFGRPGPDQGYGLKLAKRFKDQLQLQPGEHAEDAISGCLGVALRRAAAFGRAPVIYDLELAFTLFGFLGGSPTELVEFRRPFFDAASHDYWDQRDIADLVQEDTLGMSPAEVRTRLADWRSLVLAIEED